MTKTVLLGASLAALFAVGRLTAVSAANPGQFDIVSASTDGETLSMTVDEKIKQIPAKKADDLITFYAWVTATSTSTGLQADTITIHHNVNDHQEFGKAAKSSPVQSYHPHEVTFTNVGTETEPIFCISDLKSPKSDFKVQHKTVTLASENTFDFAATGTAGPISECDGFVGLGITDLYDTQ
ncbi:MAG: hypothetical protein ACRBBZ_02845 [Nitrosopumilus sp.]